MGVIPIKEGTFIRKGGVRGISPVKELIK